MGKDKLILMLITSNQREKQILHLAFEQHGATVVDAEPNHASYIKALQYTPDVILIDFPQQYTDELNFIKNIKNGLSKKKRLIAIGYGKNMVVGEQKALTANGIAFYLTRPLKFSLIIQHLENHFSPFAPEKMIWKKQDSLEEDENYLDVMFNIDILPTRKLEILCERISSLMAFPFTVMRVLQLTEDNNSGASDLAKVILADPVISANVLKMANTVFYASKNRRISTIKDAIIRIGFTETKHITMAMSVMNLLSADNDNIGFDRMQFWYHSISVAVLCEKISKDIPGINSSEMFLTGLLHSFGIILLDEFFPDLFKELLIATTDKATTFLEASKEKTVITYNDLTYRLFEGWKIPSSITEAIKNSDNLDEIVIKEPQNITPEETKGIVLYIADIVVKSLKLGNECDEVVTYIDRDLFTLVSKSNGISNQLKDTILHDIDIYKKFLKIEDNVNIDKKENGDILLVSPPPPFFIPAEHYLERLGYTIVRFSESVDHDEYNEKFTAVIFWFEDIVDSTKIEAFKNIRGGNRDKLPTISFSIDFEKYTTNNETGEYYFNNIVDLRTLLVTLTEIENS